MIESNFAAKGYAVVQDGPHLVRIYRKTEKEFEDLPLRGAELPGVKGAGAVQPENAETLPAGAINFEQADFNQVLDIYEHLSQRMVLRPTSLPMGMLILKTACPLSREEAVYAVETAMALNGIAIIHDGDLFAQAVPFSARQKVVARAPKREVGAALLDPNKMPAIGSSAAPKAPKSEVERDLEKLRTAFDEFMHYPEPRVPSAARLLHFYAKLAGKSATTSTSTNLASTMISLRLTKPLTKSELLYAIEITFSLNGFAVATNKDGTIGLQRKQ